MEFLFDEAQLRPAEPARARAPGPPQPTGGGVFDRSFPTRVAALLRSRPIADLASGGSRQDWPGEVYDLASLALAAIDLVIAHQGLEDEASYASVVTTLTELAGLAGPGRPAQEHAKVARYVLDGLLNRAERQVPFSYRISDYAAADGHGRRQIQFRLLVEREDPVRGEVVLNATGDAINALVGGLEFEVEDEQVANEILLERQLARGAFAAAERAAMRARLLSVGLADRFTALTKATRRDLSSVVESWADDVPRALESARDHLRGRVDVEHRLLVKVRETVLSDDPDIAAASVRIESMLSESRRRHEYLHRLVMDARVVFLEEQDRQAFRPAAPAHLPDLPHEVLQPLVEQPTAVAAEVIAGFFGDVAGPRAPRIPRLYRVINDLWALPQDLPDDRPAPEPEALGEIERPWVEPEVAELAVRAVDEVGLPARLSALIAQCLAGPGPELGSEPEREPEPEPVEAQERARRRRAAEVVALAALWCYADEPAEATPGGDGADDVPAAGGATGADGESARRADLALRVFGPRVAVDADDLALALPGWAGDDLVIAPDPDSLAGALPSPVTALPWGAGR